MAHGMVTGALLVSTLFWKCDAGHGPKVEIAWLGATPTNLYDAAILDGARATAKQRGGTVDAFYSGFNADLQLSQCLEIVASGDYDALIVLPAAAEGIVPCVDQAAAAGLPLVAADLPIGPDVLTPEPQVPGQTGAVLTPAGAFGDSVGELAVAACADEDPCEVVYLGGVLAFTVDTYTLGRVEDTIAGHPNMTLVAAAEAYYDESTAYTVMQGILANHPGVDLVIALGDQMARGAETAAADAGLPPGSVELIGGGAGAYAVDAVRDGRWYATFVTLPFDEGVFAADIVIDAARDLPVADPGIDPVVLAGLPRFMHAGNLELFEYFVAQWPG